MPASPPERALSAEEDRQERVDEQRRRFEEERRRREAEMARMRDEERTRLRDLERARAREFAFSTPVSAVIDAATMTIHSNSEAHVPPPPLPSWSEPVPVMEPSRPEPGLEELARPATRQGPVGAPVTPPGASAFLFLDASQRFDIATLNLLEFSRVVDEASGDPGLARRVGEHVESLLARVAQETGGPALAGSLLRERAVEWYRRSGEPAWRAAVVESWAGLFAESRIPGGRLKSALLARLQHVKEGCERSAGWGASLKRRFRVPLAKKGGPPTHHQVTMLESAQALLDDLAARAREETAPTPLVRLSELAQRRGVEAVNAALGDLLGSDARGPFVLLHPSRYPDCDLVAVRPPPSGATGALISYDLVTAKAGAAAPQPQIVIGIAGQSVATVGMASAAAPNGPRNPWEASSVAPETWLPVLETAAAQRARLDQPPRDYRSRPAYAALRALLLQSQDARLALVAARWRGRPAGLPLLAQLLADRTLRPKVATDYEYLEAELGDIERRDANYRPADLVWKIPGWSVKRGGDFKAGLVYTAETT